MTVTTELLMGRRPSRNRSVCATCFFGCAITEEAHRIIAARRVVRTWEKGAYLFRVGEETHGIWSVCRGRVKVFRETENGKQLTLRIAVPGDLAGHRSLFAGSRLSAYGVSLDDGVVTAYLPKGVVMRLIEIDATIRAQMLHHLADELGHAESLATSMAYSRAEQRLITALAELCKNNQGCSEGRPFDLTAPRQELADLAGLTVEATVRTLRRLEDVGVVKAHGHRIRIIDPSLFGPHSE
jgi:CRP-like cAMP-binding protein